MATADLLEIEGLSTYFDTEEGTVRAVDGVSLRVRPGETVCIVGESGCGKSITAMSIMGLVGTNGTAGRIAGGRIRYEDRDLLRLNKHELRTIRGHEIAMIFQEPMSSLNPVLPIGEQIMEPLIEHLKLSKKAARARAIELIAQVGIARPEQIAKAYPHELSGGMLQRIMIAIAISCGPKLLIADEPTTALDVTIQAQILDMLRQFKAESDMSILLITHDLGVVAEMADYVVVMYAGKVVEEGEVVELFERPKHPYTQGLLKSKPIMGQRQDELYSIPGQVPNPLELKPSCYFYERCEHAMDVCRRAEPTLKGVGEQGSVACWLYEEEAIVHG
ncbi:ABC transporter ATP-binding protein [Cohnella nanjingensis]|uniref:ABC transporter ATP-binding protein n=1 Tax=Cohnella nanjingensis TaxID=1387779 RepID=A0A7X0VH68_9BACL|nr:ABC transporter ATP-binding protein [Cohnella nanjingensis]MBB6673586.1 ABC transporter ATP-binding protein [Cohnella nanjingensis]